MSALDLDAYEVYIRLVGLRGLGMCGEFDPDGEYMSYHFAGRSGAPVLMGMGTGLGLRSAPRPRGGVSTC